ncbi:MAG: hypothetical protein COB77_04280 [Gammaproteobacteria bacterium]|nr:MAG: hypothetical protein COB77_04280 [Gammaproteobacteria bacterium]
MVIATILIITASSCCTPDVHYEPVELAKPAEPFLPAIKADDTACLSRATFAAFVARERLYKNYAEECIAIIDANNLGIPKDAQ